jgi:signal transduction histidine kinase
VNRPRLTPIHALATAGSLALLAVLVRLAPAAALALCVPVLLASTSAERRHPPLVAAAAAAWIGVLVLLDALASAPAGWRSFLLPLVALAIAAALSSFLQARRLEESGHEAAVRPEGDTNRLLLSLLAHDLRSPLVLADQGFQYVEESAAGDYPIDRALVADLRARLQRSLRAIGLVLTLARKETGADAETIDAARSLAEEIGAEVVSFRYEAEARGKWLVAELDDLPAVPHRVDSLVLRQAIAIALDNAIRYADPGPIRVRAWLSRSLLEVRVEDSGPGLAATGVDPGREHGSGLGLQLCSALLARAGGSLEVERDSPAGTVIAFRIPAAPLRNETSGSTREPATV